MSRVPALKKLPGRSKSSATLRQRAEAALRTSPTEIARMPPEKVQRLVHELQVHQMELEMQNEQLHETQAELTQSCERFLELYDHAPAGYLTLDATGVILEANLAAARMFALPRAELIGLPVTRFITRASQDAFYLLRRDLFPSGEARACELSIRRSTGAETPVHLECNRFTDPASSTPRCRAILIDLSERERARQELTAAQAALEEANASLQEANAELERRVAERTAQLRALAVELTRTEERERQRMAETLHEGLLQLLTAALISLAGVKKHLPGATGDLENAAAYLDEAINVGRTLTHELCPTALHNLGLVPALEWLVQRLRGKFGLIVAIDAPANLDIEGREARETLFRAARELLFNVVKHAKVRRARVSLRQTRGEGVQLVVSDAGAGFDPAAERAGEGVSGAFGLFHLRERVESLGGRFQVRSAPGRGTRITIWQPVAQPAAEDATPERPKQHHAT